MARDYLKELIAALELNAGSDLSSEGRKDLEHLARLTFDELIEGVRAGGVPAIITREGRGIEVHYITVDPR